MNQHCGNTRPHGRHTYYGPNPDPNKTTQILYTCPGTSDDRSLKPGKKRR